MCDLLVTYTFYFPECFRDADKYLFVYTGAESILILAKIERLFITTSQKLHRTYFVKHFNCYHLHRLLQNCIRFL